MPVRERLADALRAAIEAVRESGEVEVERFPEVRVDVPPSPELGDFSSGVAAELARGGGRPAEAMAELLAARLALPEELVQRVEVTRSGVLNFFLKPGWLHRIVRQARQQGDGFGKLPLAESAPSVLVEFVSANPTARLTLTHGRGAALGDALASLLEWSGCRVTREYYVNDAESGMERFGRSLEARYLQACGQEARVPPDGYQDEYLAELAEAVRAEAGDRYASLPTGERLAAVTRHGRDAVLREQRETLTRFGVRFDEWRSERDLQESGKVGEVVNRLLQEGQAYEEEGAVWLGTTRFGDEQDRPLRRSNGRATYLAGDLAYHLDKFGRGYERVVDVWGAEHRGYVGRTRAGIRALGFAEDALEIVIFESVTPKLDGMWVETPDGQGNNLTLAEVLEEVGPDVARFFYLTRPADSPLDYDLDLARSAGPENPVHRLRAACADAARMAAGAPPADADLSPLASPAEQALMRRLAEFPDEVWAAAAERDPYRLTRYATEAAAAFESFRQERAGEKTSAAQTALAEAAAVVLGNVMRVLGLQPAAP